MWRYSVIYIFLAGLFCTEVAAQIYDKETVGVRSVDIRRRGEAVDVDMLIAYDKLLITNNEQLTVTPLIISGADTATLPPVVFRGEVYDLVDQRRAMSRDYVPPTADPYTMVVFSRIDRKEREQALEGRRTPILTREDNIRYTGTFLYPVREDARVVLRQELEGCGDWELTSETNLGAIASPVPARISFLVPVVIEQEPRRARLTAHINFEQDKDAVKPEIARNSEELRKIYDFTNEMTSDEDIEVRRIIVRSYASPEATYAYNTRLSKNRAEAVKDNVIDKMDLDGALFTTENVPEDWDSLRTWIASSSIANKDRILDIIDHVSDPDVREARIKALDRSTYNMLYNQVYPNLRRTDVEIEYDLKPVTIDRALVLIETDPSKMRLDDMMHVAEYYGRDSKEYERAMMTTLRYYPYDVEPNNNMAAVALMNGDTYAAKQYLERFDDHPQCLNNMGVAYLGEGDVRSAEECFRKASDLGCEDARHNLEHLAYLEY